MKIALNNVRLAFPTLFEPRSVNGEGDPAFSANFLLPPSHPAVNQLRSSFEQLGQEKWGAKWPAIKKELDIKDRYPLHDGNTKASYAGFEGQLFVAARNKARPLVIDRDKSPLTAQDGRPYAGCWVNAVIALWVQDNQFGKRINATLLGVQFVADGDAFAGSSAARPDDFDVVEEPADSLI